MEFEVLDRYAALAAAAARLRAARLVLDAATVSSGASDATAEEVRRMAGEEVRAAEREYLRLRLIPGW